MVPDDSPFSDVSADRDYLRVALTGVCLVAVLLATATLPVLAPSGTESPIESLVPLPQENPFGSAGGSSVRGSGGGLGALNPGDRTDVGGSIGGGDSPFRSRNTETHFTVRSTEAAYWRTGAYETYIGTGWEKAARPRPYDGPLRVEGMADTAVSYEVRLAQSAASLPTVWRPRTVSRQDAMVTEYGAVRAERPVPAGTTYSATSVTPPDDPAVLRTSGRDYPDEIRARYTEIPPSTSARVGPFTDRLTADSDSPYETARAIESWLETNKEYSLNVSQPPGDDVAAEFVFEMDEGYCEYFATSMAVMLRSQDIPARYVVGYSTGERTGEREYTVRAMNAHAWVEVYFADVGWVKFDPTPGRERLRGEQQALQENGESYSATESGSPAEEFSVGTPTDARTPTASPSDTSGDGTAEDDTDGSDVGGVGSDTDTTVRAGEYRVELNRTATPGAAVTATVTRDSAPVEGATVSFNGEAVGATGPDGTVVGTIPYADRLTVGVTPPPDEASLAVPSVPRDGTRSFAVAGPSVRRTTNTSFEMETDATVSVTGDRVTGGTVTVTASVADVPVRDGAVRLDGRRVATTDDSGRARVTLPEEPGTVSVVVERDAVSGNATVVLERLAVDTAPTLPLALPGVGQTVNATMGGDPVANATVTLDGRRVARTGVDGTATVALPVASAASVTVSRYGQRATATVDGLFVNLALALLAVGVLVGGAVLGARRRGVTPAVVWAWLRSVPAAVVDALVGLAVLVDDLLARLRTRLALTVAALRDLLAGRVSASVLLDALRTWVEGHVSAAGEAAGSAVGTVSAADPRGDGTTPDARVTVREAWHRFLEHVSLREYWTHTPGEIATHAVETDGLPPEAVHTLRDAFRAVEYGKRDADDYVAAVQRAVERIEAADGDSVPEGSPDTGTDDSREVRA